MGPEENKQNIKKTKKEVFDETLKVIDHYRTNAHNLSDDNQLSLFLGAIERLADKVDSYEEAVWAEEKRLEKERLQEALRNTYQFIRHFLTFHSCAEGLVDGVESRQVQHDLWKKYKDDLQFVVDNSGPKIHPPDGTFLKELGLIGRIYLDLK